MINKLDEFITKSCSCGHEFSFKRREVNYIYNGTNPTTFIYWIECPKCDKEIILKPKIN